jgi:hypothetical protein
MKANEALIAWTPAGDPDDPTSGKVKVGELLSNPHAKDWTDPFTHTGGAAYAEVRELTGHASVARLFIDFHTLVVGDGIDPKVAHEAFLAIDEYRAFISPDIPGADLAD